MKTKKQIYDNHTLFLVEIDWETIWFVLWFSSFIRKQAKKQPISHSKLLMKNPKSPIPFLNKEIKKQRFREEITSMINLVTDQGLLASNCWSRVWRFGGFFEFIGLWNLNWGRRRELWKWKNDLKLLTVECLIYNAQNDLRLAIIMCIAHGQNGKFIFEFCSEKICNNFFVHIFLSWYYFCNLFFKILIIVVKLFYLFIQYFQNFNWVLLC